MLKLHTKLVVFLLCRIYFISLKYKTGCHLSSRNFNTDSDKKKKKKKKKFKMSFYQLIVDVSGRHLENIIIYDRGHRAPLSLLKRVPLVLKESKTKRNIRPKKRNSIKAVILFLILKEIKYQLTIIIIEYTDIDRR